MTSDELQSIIAAGLSCEHLEVSGDGRHWAAVVVSAAFEGKRLIQLGKIDGAYGALVTQLNDDSPGGKAGLESGDIIIAVDGEKIDDAIPGADYPRLVRAIGACPPEDVGGFPGYADFLEAMADPKHEEHNRMLEWYGEKFDPEEAEIGRILDNFERLAKKWTPKPRKPKAV